MSDRQSFALATRTRKGFVLFWAALFVLSMALQYVGAVSPQRALAADRCESFAIFTTVSQGQTNNENHYSSKPEVFLNGGPTSAGGGLTPGTVIYYQVQEPDGTPLMEIRSTVIGPEGTFRVQLAPFDTTSNKGNEYKVVASTEADLGRGGCTKSDNFKIDGPGSLKITKAVEGGPAGFRGAFAITVDCGLAGTFERTIVFPDPGFVTITGIDAEAECTVTEVDPPNPPAGYEWDHPTYTGNPATIESGKTVTVGVTNHLNLIPAPGFSVDKGVSLSADGPFTANLNTTTGTTVHYRITITNTGNVALTAVTLSDNTFDLVAKGCVIPTSLAVGAHFDCHYSAVAATGTTTNIATGDTGQTGPDTGTATVVATPAAGPSLIIDKTNDAPLTTIDVPGGPDVVLPTAEEGDTVTFTLTFTVTNGPVANATIVDILPDGLTYQPGSATSAGPMIFQGYNTGDRSLRWRATSLNASGSVSYRVTADGDAADLQQPLENLVTIDSDDTDADTDDSIVFVAAAPLGETFVPGVTAPPTDIIGSGETAAPGFGLALILIALAGLAFAIVMVTPMPASMRRTDRRG